MKIDRYCTVCESQGFQCNKCSTEFFLCIGTIKPLPENKVLVTCPFCNNTEVIENQEQVL